MNANRDSNEAEQLQYEFPAAGCEIVRQRSQVTVVTAATDRCQFIDKLTDQCTGDMTQTAVLPSTTNTHIVSISVTVNNVYTPTQSRSAFGSGI